jgi:hypothetical protein
VGIELRETVYVHGMIFAQNYLKNIILAHTTINPNGLKPALLSDIHIIDFML